MALSYEKVKRYTPAEYLALEDAATAKHAYYDGEIVLMAGGSATHNLITGNIYMALRQAFRGKTCSAYINDMKVRVEQRNLFTYPDVLALCGAAQFLPGRNDVVTNPAVIFEVLSHSTKKYDQTSKFELYQTLDSLESYVTVDQKGLAVGYYQRTAANRWELQTFQNLTDSFKLPSLDFEISLVTIYDEVDITKFNATINLLEATAKGRKPSTKKGGKSKRDKSIL